MENTVQCTAKICTRAETLPPTDQELLAAARKAAEAAYAPYSHFFVGAAVRLSSGLIVQGANQENVAYPSGLCAERVALFSAFSQYPNGELDSIAITAMTASENGTYVYTAMPITPCGACRQVLCEYAARASNPVRVLLGGTKEIWIIDDARQLLPFAFTF